MGRVTTTNRGLDVPDLDAAANIPADFLTLANGADGALGRLPWAMAANSVTVPTAAANSSQVTVTFPVDLFNGPPMVTVSILGAPGGSANYVPRVVSRTSASAVIGIWDADGTNITVACTLMWIAVQSVSA